MTKSFKLADLRTIVPAVTPAWIHVVEGYTLDNDGSMSKEWQDAVIPVLAYAALPDGMGAYLVSVDSDGPVWCLRRRHDRDTASSLWTLIDLHLHSEPSRGVEPRNMPEGYAYCNLQLTDWLESLEWIIE